MTLSLLMMLQEGGAEGQLPAPFRPTPGLMIWTFIVFIALLILLSKTVFPMIVKATADREARIKKDLEEAEKLRTETAALLEEQRQLLATARGEAVAIVNEARQGADRERAVAIEKTRAEQDEVLAHAKREIQVERERAIADIRREAVDLAIAAAGKVVGQRLDSAADRKLVEEYITTLGTGA
jgi:F-type H+-transporting ATPase subunit b